MLIVYHGVVVDVVLLISMSLEDMKLCLLELTVVYLRVCVHKLMANVSSVDSRIDCDLKFT
jgi:hypothetical protein